MVPPQPPTSSLAHTFITTSFSTSLRAPDSHELITTSVNERLASTLFDHGYNLSMLSISRNHY